MQGSQKISDQIRQTCQGISSLASQRSDLKPSVLGTLIVENFFSRVRGKVRFPSLFEFAIYYNHAYEELVKRFATDYICPFPKRRKGKTYGDQEGITFLLAAIDFPSRTQRKREVKAIKEQNSGTLEQLEKCKSLATTHRCSRKRLLIRGATCKIDPTKTEKIKVQFLVFCPVENCSLQKPYKVEGGLRNHLYHCHQDQFGTKVLAQVRANFEFSNYLRQLKESEFVENGHSLEPNLIIDEEDEVDETDPENLEEDPRPLSSRHAPLERPWAQHIDATVVIYDLETTGFVPKK